MIKEHSNPTTIACIPKKVNKLDPLIKCALGYMSRLFVPVIIFCLSSNISSCHSRAVNTLGTQEYFSSTEQALIKTVAAELTDDNGCSPSAGRKKVLVNAITASANRMVSDKWLAANLDPLMWSRVEGLIGILRAKNGNETVVNYNFLEQDGLESRDISALNDTSRRALLDSARCSIAFLRPAIAGNGQLALVAANIGPSAHGSLALYVLSRSDDAWNIVNRKVFYFL